jgi:hypothetical protein
MVKERQVNQITAPVEVAKKMYEIQQTKLQDLLIGPQATRQSASVNGVEIKEIIRSVLEQAEVQQ